MNPQFMIVDDHEVAQKLINLGYVLLNSNESTYVFHNKHTQNFSSDIDHKKIAYSNILNF